MTQRARVEVGSDFADWTDQTAAEYTTRGLASRDNLGALLIFAELPIGLDGASALLTATAPARFIVFQSSSVAVLVKQGYLSPLTSMVPDRRGVTIQPVAGLATVGSHAPVVHKMVSRSRALWPCFAPVWR